MFRHELVPLYGVERLAIVCEDLLGVPFGEDSSVRQLMTAVVVIECI